MFIPNCSVVDTKKCINCGRRPKGQYIELKQNNLIDPMCLSQIEQLFQVQGLDEGIKQVYKQILDLVVKCTKCKATVDKIYQNNSNKIHKDPLCYQCYSSPLKKIIKVENYEKKIFCFECEGELRGIHLLNAVQIDQIYICKNCIDGQSQSISLQKVQEKPKMPNLVKVQKKNELNHKKSLPNITSSYKQPLSKQVHKNPYMVNNFSKNNLRGFDQKYPPAWMSIKPKQSPLIRPLKIQQIRCQVCERFLNYDQFDQIQDGIHVCIDCFGKPKAKNQKKIKNNNDTFGLEDLFYCEQVEKPVQKPKVAENTKPLEKEKKEQTKVEQIQLPYTRKSNIYQLKQCKLCFFAQSKMINTKCRHLMMCEACHTNYKKTHGNKQQIPCPVCTVVGRYQLYIQPIYI